MDEATQPRYFSTTAFAGRLYVQGVSTFRGWNTKELVYLEESQVNLIFNDLIGERKVQSQAELLAAVQASAQRHPSIKVWIREGLEDTARQVWEQTRSSPISSSSSPSIRLA